MLASVLTISFPCIAPFSLCGELFVNSHISVVHSRDLSCVGALQSMDIQNPFRMVHSTGTRHVTLPVRSEFLVWFGFLVMYKEYSLV